ncbi:alpha/beta hydrolase [bacterium]|nr:MAG: alpha/beta hydrolase [bacterium]
MMKCALSTTVALACLAMPKLAQATEGSFDSNGVKIRYVTEGKGEPVVLIHGWMGDSSMWGRDASGNTKLDADPLPGFRIIALDCRGHGKSGKPHAPTEYGAEMAADVVRLLDHLKIKRAHMVGYSMGAFIVGKVAATHPERLLSAIYGGQAPLIGAVKTSGSREVEAFAKAVDEGKGLGPYILAMSPADRPKPTPEQAEAYAKYLYGGKDVKAFAASGRSFKYLAVSAKDLARCKAPALFLYGSNESSAVKRGVAAARKVLVKSQVKVVEGTDHMTTPAKPEFGATIIEFLRSHKTK